MVRSERRGDGDEKEYRTLREEERLRQELREREKESRLRRRRRNHGWMDGWMDGCSAESAQEVCLEWTARIVWFVPNGRPRS